MYQEIIDYVQDIKHDIQNYNESIDFKSNLDTHNFKIIKGKYNVINQMCIHYLTQERNENFTQILEDIDRMDVFITNIEGIIFSRMVEFKYRTSQLINELKQNRNSNKLDGMIQTLELYNEFTF
jgi:hypothetical protein